MTSHPAINTNEAKKSGDGTVALLMSVLKVTRWMMAAALMVILAGALFGPEATLTLGSDPLDPEQEGRTAYFGVFYDEDTSRAGFIGESLEASIYAVFAIYAITQILNILGKVAIGAPFVFENGTYLRRIGFAGIAAQLSVYAVWVAAAIIALTAGVSFEGMSVQISPAPWIGVLIAFSLATIFRQGAEMKQEQDLTV